MKVKNIKKKILIAIIVLLFIILITYLVGKPIIELTSNQELLKEKLNSFGIFGGLIFILLVVLQVVIALIPAEALEIGGGYIFGTIPGALICLTGIIIGSLLVILLTKKFGRKFVNLFYSDEKINSIKIFNDEKKLEKIVFLIFLIPGTPKDLLTYLIGLTKLRISSYVLLTSLARFPSIIISTAMGDAIRNNSYSEAFLYFTISALTGLIGFVIYELIITKTRIKSKQV